jgi:hypothetical protein
LNIVYHPGKYGQKIDALTRMPRNIPPKGGAEKTQQIVLKTENLDKELHKTLIVVFAKTVSLENNSTSAEERWNWVKQEYQQCPNNSRKRLCTHREQLLEIAEIQTQPTDEDKFKWIQEWHNSPVAGHLGRAKTYNLLS